MNEVEIMRRLHADLTAGVSVLRRLTFMWHNGTMAQCLACGTSYVQFSPEHNKRGTSVDFRAQCSGSYNRVVW
jgi:hypothetical protein